MHGPKWPFLLAHGPSVVVVNCWDRFCTLGRAPRTKETLPDFREWCRVTRHPRVFRRLTCCQRTPGFWGITMGFEIVQSQSFVGQAQTQFIPPHLSMG